MEPEIILFLVTAAFLAGLVDSIAGGGGLITIPVLLLAGIPPHLALGTNKLQASFGSLTACVNYRRRGLLEIRPALRGVLYTFLGAVGGTLAVLWVDPGPLKFLTTLLLVVFFLFTLLRPEMGKLDQQARMGSREFYLFAGLIMGFYDGFFGPGTGSLWTLGFVGLMGMSLPRATGHTKLVNATSNLVSLAVFLLMDQVMILPGILMGFAQAAGAFTGSNWVANRGGGLVRKVLLTVMGTTILVMVWDQWGG